MDSNAKEYRELAATIANQAEAIANGMINGPINAHVALLVNNVQTLRAWTEQP